MNKFVKLAGVSFLTLALVACGGGGGNNGNGAGTGNNGNNGSGNNGGGASVAARTGEADYAGTFTAIAVPQGSISTGGKTYSGGNFSGRVSAEADFDKDEIDVDLVGTPKANVMDRYSAEYDDVKVVNGKFTGEGRENLSANGGSLNSSGQRTKIIGSFNGNGRKISGTTASQAGLVTVDGAFTASEK